MMSLFWIMFVLFSFEKIFLISCFTTKTCSRIERSFLDGKSRYYIRLFCCGNHEPIGIQCKECKIGYTSINGDKCKKCDYGKYGKRCADLCFCSKYQRCDHMLGCVSTFVKTVSTEEQNHWTTKDMFKDSKTTYREHKAGSNESFGKNSLIYVLCAACTIIVLTLLTICMRHARSTEPFRDHRNTSGTIIQNNGSGLEQEFSERTCHYDEIEETGMTMGYPVTRTGGLDNEDSSLNGDYISNDGYLNPYQPIILYKNTHKYTKCTYMTNERKTSKSLPRSLECFETIRCNRSMTKNERSKINSI